MDVAFISEFRQGERVFRFVDTEDRSCPVRVDASDPLDETYCARVVDGTLPELIRDAVSHPIAGELPATTALPVGSHLSVPIRFSDGRVYGTLCCFSYRRASNIGEDSIRLLRALGSFVAIVLEEAETQRGESALIRSRLRDLIDRGGFSVVYQPIIDLRSWEPIGIEALTRFPDARTPDRWFAEAWSNGMGVELELAAIQRAFSRTEALRSSLYVSVNLSPASLANAEVIETLVSGPVSRLVVEVTEHAAIEDPAALRQALRPFTTLGGRVAVDDVGMGFSGLHQLVELSPSIIKLDRSLINGIDSDVARQAIVASLLTYAEAVAASVVTEGVETAEEVRMLAELGVQVAQGYHLARPADLAQLELD